MKSNTSIPNLERIARDPKLYDEAMRRIEQHVTGYARAAEPK